MEAYQYVVQTQIIEIYPKYCIYKSSTNAYLYVLNMRSDTCITLIFIFTAMLYLVSLLCFKSLLMSKKCTYFGGKHLKKYSLLLSISLVA